MKVGRNERCPCGSGLKVKRCCGVEGVRRREVIADELFGLAFNFPFCRPESSAFDAWAATAPETVTRDALDAAGDTAGVFAARYPQLWGSVVGDLGDESLARGLACAGAVLAGLEERQRPLDPDCLDLLECDRDARRDPVGALALVLGRRDLWDVIESSVAVEAIDEGATIRSVADRLWTEWHEDRLAVLVERVRHRLPVAEVPLASSALVSACDAFAAYGRVRRRLRRATLLDALPSVLDALLAA